MEYLINWKFKPVMAVIDNIGKLFTKPTLAPAKLDLRKVLFIRLEHLGDMVMATPAFETFKVNNPHCEVHVLCRSISTPIIKNNKFVDKIIEYDAPWFSSTYANKTSKKISEIARELKAEKYDVVFEMHGDPRNLYLANSINSCTIGYPNRGFGFFCDVQKEYNHTIKTIQQNLNLIRDYTSYDCLEPKIFTDSSVKVNVPKSFVIINPKSTKIEKDLLDDEVDKIIKANSKETVIITGSKQDIGYNLKFDRFPNVVNLTGKTSILELIEIVNKAKKVYCPDTGIMHIAHALNIPCDSFFKSTNPKVWGY